MTPPKITVCLTSCGRYDLLKQTLDSFFAVNTYPIEAFYIHEDSFNSDRASDSGFIAVMDLIADSLKDKVGEFLVTPYLGKRGLSASLDCLYAKSKSNYILSLENDWSFNGNPNFIADSIKILEAHPDIHQVWCRHEKDHTHPLSPELEIEGIPCKAVLPKYQGHWQGFSWNPHVKRLSDYKRMFPNGYAEFGDEAACSRHANKFDYKAVALINSACKHIGNGRHTPNFKQ